MHSSILITMLLFATANAFHAFVPQTSHKKFALSPLSMTSDSITVKTTLTEETTWKLRFILNGITSTNGRKVDDILFVVNAQFLEDDGYEPPQGSVRQVSSQSEEGDTVEDNSCALNISLGRWQLSEDPEDRKDGLWIWGLFKEPLYPFMLLKLETKAVELPGEEKDSIKPLKLFAQISHIRDKEKGVILQASELKIRDMETVKADLIGAATVEVYEEVSVGQLSIIAA